MRVALLYKARPRGDLSTIARDCWRKHHRGDYDKVARDEVGIDCPLKLPREIDDALAREARRAYNPGSALFRRAVEAYPEELADACAVDVARS